MRVLALLVVLAAARDVQAERGHQLYTEMVTRQKMQRFKTKLRAMYSCKPRGTPLLVIESAGDTATRRLVLYSTGAVRAVGEEPRAACVKRRVIDWVRWQLANVTWRKRRPSRACSAVSSAVTRFSVRGRETHVERDCGPTLPTRSRERLVEVQAVLEAALRNAQ